MDFHDFSNYSKGMDSLARFFPKTWSGIILLVGIPAFWAVWAYYSHVVLVLMLFALAFMVRVDGNLVHGLIITGQEGVESLRQEAESLRNDLREAEEKLEVIEDLRREAAGISKIIEVCGLGDYALMLDHDRRGETMDWLPLPDLHRLVKILAKRPYDVDTLYDAADHGGDNYVPSVLRLEGEIARLRGEIEVLKGNNPA